MGIGAIGNATQIAAYVPQIIHMYKTKKSGGISIKANLTWLTGDILLFIYSVCVKDPIFIILTTCYVFFTAWIVLLTFKFKNHSPLH